MLMCAIFLSFTMCGTHLAIAQTLEEPSVEPAVEPVTEIATEETAETTVTEEIITTEEVAASEETVSDEAAAETGDVVEDEVIIDEGEDVIADATTTEETVIDISTTTEETVIDVVATGEEISTTSEEAVVEETVVDIVDDGSGDTVVSLSTPKVVEDLLPEGVTDEVTELDPLEAEFHTPPDFVSDVIKDIKGFSPEVAIVQIERNQQDELWLFNVYGQQPENIESGSSVAADFPIGFKAGFIFWLSADHQTVYAFRPQDKVFLEKAVPAFDPALGERGVVRFEEVAWDVLVSSDNFYFYSPETGEVFSDENSESMEPFRRNFNLDSVLTSEELGDLSFSDISVDE